MLKIIEKTKIWFSISLIIILIGVVFMISNKGLELGIDFAGGSTIRLKVPTKFSNDDKVEADKIIKKHIPDATTNIAETPTESNTMIKELEIKTKATTEEVKGGKVTTMTAELKEKFGKEIEVTTQDEIGKTVGKETTWKALGALALATVFMLIYIGFRFEVKFATAAVLSLIHDVLITVAFYAVFRKQVDLGFVAAMLTVIGYSINDTIVVFDRIRENQKYMGKASITEIANASLTQTMARSINTVMTVLITLVAVYIFVPSIRNFSEPLLVGIISGCYSSIFIASPFYVIFKNRGKKKAAIAK